ncbi:MAG: hypothetical protein QI223_05695 [Candidatus Korarchaeota archaeon]|nr:hypothetical protein [Candidatus Korarchaeota archaeon]
MKSRKKERRGNNPKHEYGICRVHLDSKGVLLKILADVKELRRDLDGDGGPWGGLEASPGERGGAARRSARTHLKFIYRLGRLV